MKFNNKYNKIIKCVINATLVQAVLDQKNTEVGNSRERLTENF